MAGGAGALALGVDGALVEPLHPVLTRLEIPLQRLPEAFNGFTIAQLSDFHYDDFSSIHAIRAAIQMVNQAQPDLVALTGDFITVPLFRGHFHRGEHALEQAEPCAQELSGLRSRLGSLAVLGNHDAKADPERISRVLQSHGIPVLRNRAIPLEKDGARIWVAGVDDVMEGYDDVDAALQGVPANEAVVLLVHEPDVANRVARYPVDLQLSGHSHGGQVWLPLIGAPWLPPLARRYPRGMHKIRGLTLYTNIGLGTIRLPVRVNCPPEVTLVTLRPQGQSKV